MGRRTEGRTAVGAVAILTVAASLVALAPAASAETWQAEDLVSAAGSGASDPIVLSTREGRFVTLWYDESEAGGTTVWSSSRGPSEPEWSDPTPVSDSGGDASGLQADVDARGRVTAVWLDSRGGADSIRTATSVDTRSWSDPVQLSAAGEAVAAPDVDVALTGHAAVVWRRTPTSGDLVIALRERTGPAAQWGPTQTRTTRTEVPFAPQVGVVSGWEVDEVTIAWHNSGGMGERLMATVWRYGNWEPIRVLGTLAMSGDAPTGFQLDPGGSAVWVTEEAGERLVRGWVRDFGSWWNRQSVVLSEGSANPVDLAVSGGDGSLTNGFAASTIVWRDDGAQDHLRVTGFSAVTPETLASADTLSAPVLAQASDRAAVLWTVSEDGAAPTGAVATGTGATWSAPGPVPGFVGPVAAGRLALDPFGDLAVAWTAAQGGDQRVVARIRDADGPVPLLDRLPVFATGRQATIRVAWSLPDWEPTAVESQQLQVRRTNRTGSTAWRDVTTPAVPATGTVFRGRPGNTYCFRVRAFVATDLDPDWSAIRCSTTALDARVARGPEWKRVRHPQAYRGTLSVATRAGARVHIDTTPAGIPDCVGVGLLLRTTPHSGGLVRTHPATLPRRISLVSPRPRNRVVRALPGQGYGHCGEHDVQFRTRNRRPVAIDGAFIVWASPDP